MADKALSELEFSKQNEQILQEMDNLRNKLKEKQNEIIKYG